MKTKLFSLRNLICFLFSPYQKFPSWMLVITVLYEVFLLGLGFYVFFCPECLDIDLGAQSRNSVLDIVLFQGEFASSWIHGFLIVHVFLVVPCFIFGNQKILDIFLWIVSVLFTACITAPFAGIWHNAVEYIYLIFFWAIVFSFAFYKYIHYSNIKS